MILIFYRGRKIINGRLSALLWQSQEYSKSCRNDRQSMKNNGTRKKSSCSRVIFESWVHKTRLECSGNRFKSILCDRDSESDVVNSRSNTYFCPDLGPLEMERFLAGPISEWHKNWVARTFSTLLCLPGVVVLPHPRAILIQLPEAIFVQDCHSRIINNLYYKFQILNRNSFQGVWNDIMKTFTL